MTLRTTAWTHLAAGQPAAALHLVSDQLARDPSDAAAWVVAAEALLALARPAEAAQAAAQAVANHATAGTPSTQARAWWALALATDGASADAVDQIATVLDEVPGNATTWELVARTFEALGEVDAGLEARREAVRCAPRDAAFALRLADRLERADQRVEARSVVNDVLSRGRNTVAERILVRLDHHDGDLESAATRARRLVATVPHRGTYLELARLEARLGNPAAAWNAAGHGNALALGAWIANGGELDALPRTLDLLATAPVGPFPTGTPDGSAFLMGFPRSGTTLLEQRLQAHPGITALDELPLIDAATNDAAPGSNLAEATERATEPNVAQAIRDGWWRRVNTRVPPREGVVIDKLPLNLLRVELLAKAFPASPMVLVVRDPRDAVLSAYLQDFELNQAMAQCATIERCADLYARAFGRWLQVRDQLPQALEVRYEALVNDPETTLRAVLTHLGLPWDPAVLGAVPARTVNTPSYRDVQNPIYTRSVGRWRAFEAQLAPVLPTLAPFVDAFGYAR